MTPGGEHAARRGGLTVASILLRAALIIAVVLMPLLTCPAASDAPGLVGTSAASASVDQVPHVLANLVSAEDHHDCHALPVTTAAVAAATGVLTGWAVAAAAVTFVALAVCAMWRPSTHGPPRVQPHWLLSNGYERLLHFCVLRR